MNYSNTVVMHAPKEKLRGILEENILCIYIHDKQNIEKDRQGKENCWKEENWMGKSKMISVLNARPLQLVPSKNHC